MWSKCGWIRYEYKQLLLFLTKFMDFIFKSFGNFLNYYIVLDLINYVKF
jgi:hypothetical protein